MYALQDDLKTESSNHLPADTDSYILVLMSSPFLPETGLFQLLRQAEAV